MESALQEGHSNEYQEIIKLYFYNLQNFLKRGKKKNLRFKIVKKLTNKKTSLIDVCGGCGWLKEHLDPSIKYTVADASKEFGEVCKKKDINFTRLNCKKINFVRDLQYKKEYRQNNQEKRKEYNN